MLAEIGQVGVDEDEQIAGGDVQRLPQHLTLARIRAEVGQDLVPVVHGRPGRGGDLGRLVHRPRVDHYDLVDETGALGQAPHAGHDVTDGGLLVQRREDHADPVVALARHQPVDGSSRRSTTSAWRTSRRSWMHSPSVTVRERIGVDRKYTRPGVEITGRGPLACQPWRLEPEPDVIVGKRRMRAKRRAERGRGVTLMMSIGVLAVLGLVAGAIYWFRGRPGWTPCPTRR